MITIIKPRLRNPNNRFHSKLAQKIYKLFQFIRYITIAYGTSYLRYIYFHYLWWFFIIFGGYIIIHGDLFIIFGTQSVNVTAFSLYEVHVVLQRVHFSLYAVFTAFYAVIFSLTRCFFHYARNLKGHGIVTLLGNFMKGQKVPSHQSNSKTNDLVLLLKTI